MNRREFLSSSVAMGSWVALGAPGLAGAEPRGAGIHLGLVTYNLARAWDIDTIIRRCEAHGFDRVELRSTHKHGVEPSLNTEARRQVRDRFAGSRVRLLSLGSACEYHSPDPAKLRENVELTRDFMRLAKEVGAVAVKVRPNGLPSEVPVEKTLDQIGGALADLGAWSAAEGQEIELWLEVHGGGTSHVPHIRTIMERAKHPLVGVTWNCNGSDLIAGSCRENWLLVHSWVRALHIHDLWDENQYPWRELFTVMGETRWSGHALWERNSEAEDPDALMARQRAAFLELAKLAAESAARAGSERGDRGSERRAGA